LEGGRGVLQAKGHYLRDIEAIWSDESGLPLVVLFDADIVVSPVDVQCGEEGLALQLF
jgi:hypothetical protein